MPSKSKGVKQKSAPTSANKRRQFASVEWPPNDRIHGHLGAQVLYCGQIGATVSEGKAATIFRVDESSRFLQKFGIYQIIRPQDRYMYHTENFKSQ